MEAKLQDWPHLPATVTAHIGTDYGASLGSPTSHRVHDVVEFTGNIRIWWVQKLL